MPAGMAMRTMKEIPMFVRNLLVFASILSVLGLAGCKSDDASDSSEAKQDACTQSCVAAISAQCPAEKDQPISACESDCMSAFEHLSKCEKEIFAMIRCPGLLESTGWSCESDGKSYPSADVCVTEQAAMETCSAK
jgi:outer membrane murein-binding lipoprotein Lpp